jgi:peptidoglycan/xylan/chitin deacetylase (PgdA/CDA1 family)
MEEVAENGHSYEFLTWDEIRQMDPLVKIESHGHKHLHYPRNTAEKNKEDIGISTEIIKKETGRQPKYFAWPFGEYDQKSIETAKKSGLEACFTAKIGGVKKNDDIYKLNRLSPPRRNLAFKIAIKNHIGIIAYNLGIKMWHL